MALSVQQIYLLAVVGTTLFFLGGMTPTFIDGASFFCFLFFCFFPLFNVPGIWERNFVCSF
jgi:hypothetical protein